MPARDPLGARAHDHLLHAAAAHDRAARGEEHATEGAAGTEQAAKRHQKSERVKRQPRRDGGKFA